MWLLLIGLTWFDLGIFLHLFTFKLQYIVYRLFLEPLWGNYPYVMHLQEDHMFSVMNQTKPWNWWEKNLFPCPPPRPPRLSQSFFPPTPLHSLHPEPGRQLFSPTPEERRILNCGSWLSCQNNSKLYTCRLLASWEGKMTNVVSLAFSSWQAHHWLCFSPPPLTKAWISPLRHWGN